MPDDLNGFEIKEGHRQEVAVPHGPYVWLLRRHDDKLFGVFTSRHEAVGRAATLDGNKREWFTSVRVRAGSVRLKDMVVLDG